MKHQKVGRGRQTGGLVVALYALKFRHYIIDGYLKWVREANRILLRFRLSIKHLPAVPAAGSGPPCELPPERSGRAGETCVAIHPGERLLRERPDDKAALRGAPRLCCWLS